VKAPLRPFEYMKWAKTVPSGARYDLTASGMRDTAERDAPGFDLEEGASSPFDVATQCRRQASIEANELFIETVAGRYGLDPSCVTPTLGASLAITHVLIALVRAGDHVIVERPTYEALRRVPEILGAQVSRLERKFEEGWRVVPERLAQLLTPRTRAVILTNLHNPSGVAIDRAAMTEITDLAGRVGAMVLVDEVYLDYGWGADDDLFVPACRVARNGISWSSTTKAFGFSALRAGWIVAPDPDAARAIRSATDYLHVHPPTSTVALGTRVLRRADALVAYARDVSAAGRRVVTRWLDAESRVSWVAPAAGITGCLRLPELMDDVAFCEHLRERYETQIVPGTMFEAPGFVRLSFAVEPSRLEQALGNISAALDDLS
jgi:aspartate/methionine/tyrosine aminotransferase